MGLRFESSHEGDVITLTLFDESNSDIWSIELDRNKTNSFISMLFQESDCRILYADGYSITIIKDGKLGTILMIGDGSPYLKFKVILSNEQVKDLASTLRMHSIASEEETRPKDPLPPLDDALSGPWTPEREKQMFGEHEDDEDDPSENWKKGR